jgi:hypothetical protein
MNGNEYDYAPELKKLRSVSLCLNNCGVFKIFDNVVTIATLNTTQGGLWGMEIRERPC